MGNNAEIKYYLTSLQNSIAQTNLSQSIGGYISTSLLYPETTITSTISFFDTTLVLNDFTQVLNYEYLFLGYELIKVNTITSNTVTVQERSVNGIRDSHILGDIVKGVSSRLLFDNFFNEDNKQYRCFAIKNVSTATTFFNVLAKLSLNSQNGYSSYRIAVEIPTNDYVTSTSTSAGTDFVLIDSSLTSYNQNQFDNAVINILSGVNLGQTRIISSFDSLTGSVTVSSAFPHDIVTGVNYEIEPAPAQRVSSGELSPNILSTRFSGFNNVNIDVPIDINNLRDNGSNLEPNDVVYVWIERSLLINGASYDNNTFVLDVDYSDIGGS